MFNRFIGKRSSRKPAAKTDDPGTVASAGNGSSTSSASTVVRGSLPANVPKGGSGTNQTVAQGSLSPPPNVVALAKPNGISTNFPPENLPAFRDVPVSDRQVLFLMKLNLCCTVFDFADVNKNVKEKETKRQTLLELVDYVSSTSTGVPKFTEAVTEEIFRMISMNLFRALPPPPHDSTAPDFFEPDEEEPAMDPAWPHLHMVYEFLLRYVASPEADPKTAKKYIDHSFVSNLLDLFDSEDQRERDYLKTILHRIYGKFMVHRPFIRKVINNIFYRFVYETEKHNGIAELLEVLGSIINGFAMPLKEEHKLFLVRGLIPLHKPKCVAMYHQQLSYCITQFVEKDSKLADTVIRGLLKFWPVTNSHKELLFLGELEVVLETTQPAEFQRCMYPLFRQIGRCMNSPHFQVAERALFLWNNDHIVALVLHNRQVILPLIFSALEKNTKNHWNKAVYDLTLNVRKMFFDMDQGLFQTCQEKFTEEEAKAESVEQRRVANWKCLETLATEKGPIQ